MVDGKSGFDWRKDGLGLVLFGAGAFALVLAAMSLFVDVGAVEARGTTALARQLVGALGVVPALLGAAGLATLGALAFLGGRDLDLPRHAAGVIGTTLGSAVLLGTFGAAGGTVGAATGGALADALTPFVAVPLGLLAVLVPVTLAWIPAWKLAFSGWRRPVAAASTEADVGGVSTEEAAALVPDEATLDYMQEVWAAAATVRQPVPIPPSPYPEDVRLKGEIPRGAQPLRSDARSQVPFAPEAPGGDRRLPEDRRGPDLGTGPDLALPSSGRIELRAAKPLGEPPPAGAQALARPLGTTPLPSGPEHAGPPKPAWEQPDLFSEEEPARDEVAGEEAPDPAAARELLEVEAEIEDDDSGYVEDPDAEYEEEDEADEETDLDVEYEEEDAEYEDAEADEDPDDTEDELDVEYEAEVDEDEDEELDDEDEYEDDEEVAEDDGEIDAEEEEDVEEEDVAAETDDEVTDEEAGPVPSAVGPLAEAEEVPAEREVVLEPRPRRVAGGDSRDELVHRAGLLIAERGRVAVSLLQRSFGLGFDEACEVLDELQDQGLIGPYLGGQRRDILLSLDEWRRRVPSS